MIKKEGGDCVFSAFYWRLHNTSQSLLPMENITLPGQIISILDRNAFKKRLFSAAEGKSSPENTLLFF